MSPTEQINAIRKEFNFTVTLESCRHGSNYLPKAYIRPTPKFLKDKLKLSSTELTIKYYNESFFYVYDMYTLEGCKKSSSKKFIDFCKKNSIKTKKIIGRPTVRDGEFTSEDYKEVYLFSEKVTNCKSDFYKEIVDLFDLVTIEKIDNSGNVYKKVLPISKTEYAKIKLKSSQHDLNHINDKTFRIVEFLSPKTRNRFKVKKIIKKYMKPIYIKVGSYYAINNVGDHEEIIFAEDFGWTKA